MMDTIDVVVSSFYDINDNDLKELWNSDGFDETVSYLKNKFISNQSLSPLVD